MTVKGEATTRTRVLGALPSTPSLVVPALDQGSKCSYRDGQRLWLMVIAAFEPHGTIVHTMFPADNPTSKSSMSTGLGLTPIVQVLRRQG